MISTNRVLCTLLNVDIDTTGGIERIFIQPSLFGHHDTRRFDPVLSDSDRYTGREGRAE
jgi:hypothetical protein